MSMYPGNLIAFRLMCPTCATILPGYQSPNSAFFLIECNNPDCADRGASALVDRQSGLALSVTRWEWADASGQRWRQVYEKVPAEGSTTDPKETA